MDLQNNQHLIQSNKQFIYFAESEAYVDYKFGIY